jgi:hypothetical protein
MFSSTRIGGTLVPSALEVVPYHLRLLFFLLSFLFDFLVFLLSQTDVDDSQSEDFDGGILWRDFQEWLLVMVWGFCVCVCFLGRGEEEV